MKLEDFVSETLRQVLNGVVKAQAHANELGGKVNPTSVRFRTDQGMQLYDRTDGALIERIDFNVAVTTVEGTEAKAGTGIFVGPIALGAQGQSSATNQSTSTIKFSVPIKFPTNGGNA